MKKTLILGLLMLMASVAGAQERNAARLMLEDTSYVDVSLGVVGAMGRMRDIFEPEAFITGRLSASSRRTLGRVHLFGHFGYDNTYGRGSTWRGWIDPYSTPFMLADSIPGNISLERYSMEAGAALPLGGGWSAGLGLAYDVSLMAKHKDLRNKNTGMDFRVSPGVHWQGRLVGLGLDLGYERGTEKVEYMQVSESVEHVLFDLYGLWLYHSSGFSSAENRRLKEENRFSAGLQLDLNLGGAVFHNELRGFWRQSVQTETGYNNLRFGDVRELTWSDDFSLEIGGLHRVEGSFTLASMQGFRPLQRQELDPASRIRVWVTYGDPVFCYWRQYHHERLSYTYGRTWQLTAGVDNWRVEHAYTEYPQRFSQKISTVTPFLEAEVPVRAFSFSARVGFEHDYDAHTEVTEWQLREPLLRQWDFWNGDDILLGIGAAWSRGRCYVRGSYDSEIAVTPGDGDGFRAAVSLTVGFIF